MKKKEFDFRSIDSLEAAIKKTGRQVADFSSLPDGIRDRHQAIDEMEIICEAVNDGWVSDWENTNQPKYRCWFWMSPSGFAFDYSFYDYDYACAGSGSRLHLETRDKSDHIGSNQAFLSIWKRIQLG